MRRSNPEIEIFVGTSFVATRRFGNAEVSVISEGGMRWAPKLKAPEAEWRRAIPEADAAGAIMLGLNSAVIQAGEAVIVVVPGFADPADAQAAHTHAPFPGWGRVVAEGEGYRWERAGEAMS